MDKRTVGILGGGQLGRMIIESANKLGVRVAILDPEGPTSPAGQLAHLCVEGSYKNDVAKIRDLASISDVITTEIEHVDVSALSDLAKEGHTIHPDHTTLRIIQDKLLQKEHLDNRNIPVGEFVGVQSVIDAEEAGSRLGYPFILKNRKLAYDGRGNAVVHNEAEAAAQFNKLGGVDVYAERWVPYSKELAVIVVRCKEGLRTYPVVETVQRDSICHAVIAPANISPSAQRSAADLARNTVDCFTGLGVYGVEMFLLHDDTVMVNEVAPRPHNSGHYTIEACEVDQFEMHLRAILGLPCPTPRMKVPAALMLNVLGKSSMEATKETLRAALAVPGASIHWYGKLENRPGRKMAHITLTGESLSVLRDRAELLGVGSLLQSLPAAGPRVGVIMGSDSDLPVMQEAARVLEQFGVTFELTIVSAHRTPTRMYSYAQSAVERGLQVIVAGAGGAAHLPGMVAALTSLPVIGVPMHTAALGGQDSLLSMVQMPKGVPVATVAIGNAANAALLAVRILGSQDPKLQAAMDEYMLKQEEEVLRKAVKLESQGYDEYAKGLK